MSRPLRLSIPIVDAALWLLPSAKPVESTINYRSVSTEWVVVRLQDLTLFRPSYFVNPGGALAGKGTYVGHRIFAQGTRIGLRYKITQAQIQGCPILQVIIDLVKQAIPTSPLP